jgi:hypothetical protein
MDEMTPEQARQCADSARYWQQAATVLRDMCRDLDESLPQDSDLLAPMAEELREHLQSAAIGAMALYANHNLDLASQPIALPQSHAGAYGSAPVSGMPGGHSHVPPARQAAMPGYRPQWTPEPQSRV